MVRGYRSRFGRRVQNREISPHRAWVDSQRNGEKTASRAPQSGFVARPWPSVPAHRLTFVGLWLFTALLIFRPGQTPDGNNGGARFSFIIAVLTLLSFVVSQLRFEKRLSARPLEVTLVVLLCGGALLSMPNAYNSSEAMGVFMDVFIKAVLMFIVMINAVRSEKRLVVLFWLVLAAGIYVSYGALDAYRLGQFSDEGYRVRGNLGATLNDPNDTALYLVTMMPVALALRFSARARWARALYFLTALIMLAAIFVTYSRGGFLALSCAGIFLTWKMFRRSPLRTVVCALLGAFALTFLLPSNYTTRLSSIFDSRGDTRGSATARRRLLYRSIEIASEYPLNGIGMGNFHNFSIKNQVSHNSYTQVASEMGLPVLAIYLAFIIAPLARLRRMERETWLARDVWQYRRLHFLALGLQASLLGFLVGSFFLSVAYYWFLYYLVGYAVCVSRIYETEAGRIVGTFQAVEKAV